MPPIKRKKSIARIDMGEIRARLNAVWNPCEHRPHAMDPCYECSRQRAIDFVDVDAQDLIHFIDEYQRKLAILNEKFFG